MKPAMYLFINAGLDMSAGKIAAQAGHASVEAYRLSDVDLLNEWYRGKHYTKLVMEARDSEHLRDIQTYLEARGFRTALILDEGHTEVPPISPTALGVEVVDKDDPHTAATFSSFKLFRAPRPSEVAPRGETVLLESPQRTLWDRVRRMRPTRTVGY